MSAVEFSSPPFVPIPLGGEGVDDWLDSRHDLRCLAGAKNARPLVGYPVIIRPAGVHLIDDGVKQRVGVVSLDQFFHRLWFGHSVILRFLRLGGFLRLASRHWLSRLASRRASARVMSTDQPSPGSGW